MDSYGATIFSGGGGGEERFKVEIFQHQDVPSRHDRFKSVAFVSLPLKAVNYCGIRKFISL